jgi:hypothetical protein
VSGYIVVIDGDYIRDSYGKIRIWESDYDAGFEVEEKLGRIDFEIWDLELVKEIYEST